MKKRILFLSDIDSAHTRKWAVSLAERGFEIGIFSIKKSETNWYGKYPALKIFDQDGFSSEKFNQNSSSKISYLKLLPRLKEAIRSFQPDILHAHYASSYGLLGNWSDFHPLVISVWGSDIFEFPHKSILHRLILFNNLRSADMVLSTSEIMKKEILNYVNREIQVTYFGVDTQLFFPKSSNLLFPENVKVIGVIKSLEKMYGIDVLINAFSIVKKQFSGELKLVIAGTGTQEKMLKSLAKELELENEIVFPGKIPQEEVADHHNRFDIFVNISRYESFGVTILEAMACEKPLVASNVGGPAEIVEDNSTGLLVPIENPEKTADAILFFLNNPEKAIQFGKAGRKKVLEKFDWNKNVDDIIVLYNRVAAK